MSAQTYGIYIGGLDPLKGKTALLRSADEDDHVLAQFDDPGLTHPSLLETRPGVEAAPGSHLLLGVGWTRFPAADFDLDVR